MSNEFNIDDNKLREAKEKLACHIEPPKAHAAPSTESSCGTSAPAFMDGDKVKLTQLTTAGG